MRSAQRHNSRVGLVCLDCNGAIFPNQLYSRQHPENTSALLGLIAETYTGSRFNCRILRLYSRHSMRIVTLALVLIGFLSRGVSAEPPRVSYAELIRSDNPVAYWRFELENPASVRLSQGTAKLAEVIAHGKVSFQKAGPRPA